MSSMLMICILGGFSLTSVCQANAAPGNDDAWKLKVQNSIQAYIDADQNVGVNLAFIRNGETVLFSFGKTDLNLPGKPAVDTVFQIGSASKTFTSILLAALVNRGDARLEDPISKLLPEISEIQNSPVGAITLQQLSTHTSGLPRLPVNLNPVDPNNPYADYSSALLLEALKAPGLLTAAGPYPISYSNMGVSLLGYLLERISGKTYEQLIAEIITGPLGMHDTGVSLSADQAARSAQGYDEGFFKMPFWDFSDLAAAGGIHSTLTDMISYLRANLNPDQTELGRAIEFSHQLQVHGSAQSQGLSPSSNIGLGWILNEIAGNQIVWHNGEVGGFVSYTAVNKTLNSGVEFLSNTASSEIENCLAYLLVEKDCPAPPAEFLISETSLQGFVGKYEFPSLPGHTVEILKPGHFLSLNLDEQFRARLHADSANHFKGDIQELPLEVEFQTSSAGSLSLVFTFQGQSISANRVP